MPARNGTGASSNGGSVNENFTFDFKLFSHTQNNIEIQDSNANPEIGFFLNAVEDIEIINILPDNDLDKYVEYKYIAVASLKAEIKVIDNTNYIIYSLTDANGNPLVVLGEDSSYSTFPTFGMERNKLPKKQDLVNSLDSIIEAFNDGIFNFEGLKHESKEIDILNLGYDIVGNSNPNNLGGTNLAEEIKGLAGNDTISGNLGNDTLRGGNGNDLLNGGDGNDSLVGEQGNDTLKGQNNNDVLRGLAGNDSLEGSNGSDTLVGGFGLDTLKGGNGNDVLYGDSDHYHAGHVLGHDDFISGNSGDDSLYGGGGNDTLNGGSDRDSLNGGAGNDILNGNDGNDYLWGDIGNDTLNGGSGSDTLNGDYGNDNLNGGSGSDSLNGGNQNDILNGYGNSINEFDTLTGGGGADKFMLGAFSSSSSNTYYKGSGYATIVDYNSSQGDKILVSGNTEDYTLSEQVFIDLQGIASISAVIEYYGDRIALIKI